MSIYPVWLQIIIELLASLIRFLGLVVFGLGFGWLALDLLKKAQLWYLQMAIFLGTAGLMIAFAFGGWLGIGPLALGLGVALLIWGIMKKEKKEVTKK